MYKTFYNLKLNPFEITPDPSFLFSTARHNEALASLYYSFTNFKILQVPRWVGLDNYAALLNDPLFWKSLSNTLYLTVVGVPLAVVVALAVLNLVYLPRAATRVGLRAASVVMES